MVRNDWIFAAVGWDPEFARRVPRRTQRQLGVLGLVLGLAIAALSVIAMLGVERPMRFVVLALMVLTTLAFGGLNWIIRRELFGRLDLEKDARAAAEIQSRLVPATLPSMDGIEMAHHYSPFRLAGGDFYDVIPLDDGRLLIAMADVSGKGTAAALITASLQAILRLIGAETRSMEGIIAEVHAHLLRHTETGRFVTMFLARLDPADGELEYINAGHNPALVVGEGGVRRLESTTPPLGAVEGTTFAATTEHIAPGETLLVYTDGLSERPGPGGAFFGEAGIVRTLEHHRRAGPGAIVSTLVAAATTFAAGEPADDDTAILALRRAPGAIRDA